MGSGSSKNQQSSIPVSPPAATSAPQLTVALVRTEAEQCIRQSRAHIALLEADCAKREAEAEEAKTLATQYFTEGNSKEALKYMRRSKQFEKDAETIHGMIINVEMMIVNVETSVITHMAAASLQLAEATLREMQNQLPTEQIERIIAEHKDVMAEHEDTELLISQGRAQDDDVLLAELQELSGGSGVSKHTNTAAPSSTTPVVLTASSIDPSVLPAAPDHPLFPESAIEAAIES